MPNIFIKNQEMYDNNVVVTDDNQQGVIVFNEVVQQETSSNIFFVQPSEAGYGDVHYRVNGGDAVASSLMNEGDYILI